MKQSKYTFEYQKLDQHLQAGLPASDLIIFFTMLNL